MTDLVSFGIELFSGSELYGGNPGGSVVMPFTVQLDGVTYAVQLEGYKRASQESLSETVVPTREPSDALFSTNGAWWRYRHRWSHGAGQHIDDLDDDADPFRFMDSFGVDVWDPHDLSLLPASVQVKTYGSSQSSAKLCFSGGRLFSAFGSTLEVRDSYAGAWSAVTVVTGTINDLATDGTTLYIATTTNVYTIGTSGTAAVLLSAGAAEHVQFMANKLIVGEANLLREVAAGGARTTVFTHFQAAFRWTGLIQLGSRIYAGGFAGDRTEIYQFTVTTGGALALGAEAVTLPYGEVLHELVSYAGTVVVFATSKGVRFGQVSGDGAIEYGPLIDAPGASRALAVEGRFAYFGWDAIAAGWSGLGRMALDTLVGDTLQPAYARDIAANVTGTVGAVARAFGYTWYAVLEHGVYADDDDTWMASGWVESGEIYMGTVEAKTWSQITLSGHGLDTGESWAVEVSGHDGEAIGSGSIATLGATQLDVPLESSQTRAVTVKVTLAGDTTSTPRLTQWRIRGFPIVPGVEQWIVPLLVHSVVTVNDGQGQAMSQDVRGVVDAIRTLWRERTQVIYGEGIETHRVRVDNYEFVPTEWDDYGRFFEGVATVRLVEV